MKQSGSNSGQRVEFGPECFLHTTLKSVDFISNKGETMAFLKEETLVFFIGK